MTWGPALFITVIGGVLAAYYRDEIMRILTKNASEAIAAQVVKDALSSFRTSLQTLLNEIGRVDSRIDLLQQRVDSLEPQKNASLKVQCESLPSAQDGENTGFLTKE
ncbi:MAG: hypothetical protein F6K21_05575 [Symploca sp. SIO2D2]|nr:hypothetical protein [Symploca sp. SIO2D2]